MGMRSIAWKARWWSRSSGGPDLGEGAEVKRRPRLVYRADASERIGTGHVMRGIALAQAWQEAGGEALFVLAASTPAV